MGAMSDGSNSRMADSVVPAATKEGDVGEVE